MTLTTVAAALTNMLALLGMAFVLSRGFVMLRQRPARLRSTILGFAFGAMAVGSMMMSFPMAPGIIGDLRNVVIAVAAIVGGPVPALIATAIAAAYRVQLGGEFGAAILGIVIAATLSIWFAQSKAARTPQNLVLFGIGLAAANASLPLVALLFSSLTLAQAIGIGMTVMIFAGVTYPLAIALIAGLLLNEQKRAENEAELKMANYALSLDAARTEGVFERSGVAMAWSDLKSGRIIRVNPQYSAFIGYPEGEMVGKRFDELAPDDDRQKEYDEFRPFIAGETQYVSGEKRYLRKDGTVVWGLRSVTAVSVNGVRYAFAMIQDITDHKRAREEIAYLASHDSLTGLVNRLVFQGNLQDALSTRRADEAVVVLCLDLDDFKEINDTLGHPTGDLILIEVARRLRTCVDPTDVIARFGGDEFAILRRGRVTADEIAALARRVIDRVGDTYVVGTDVARVGVSIGIVRAPADGLDVDELTRKADIALYSAKAAGRNVSKFFEPEMEERLLARQALKVDLAAALLHNELRVEYQPVVSLATGAVAGFEALLRWHHRQRGVIPPVEFIPLAEETGLIGPIGSWVLEAACRQALTWPAEIRVAVNVSPIQFRDSTFALRVAEVLARTGLRPDRLELEITETVLLLGGNDTLRCLGDLRALGVKIALDDFGTGYSSLSYLQRFPFDKIKIDRSFVADVISRRESQAVIRAVIGLGHSLKMQITAEGIETQEQFDRLRAKGCDEAQGFLISTAVPADQVPALIASLAADSPRLAASHA